MNVDEALRVVACSRELPRVAIGWALDHWEDASRELIYRFCAFEAGRDRSEAARIEAFYAVHLCAEMRETAVFAPLCRMIAADPSISQWLGDAVTETLPGILIRVCTGHVGPLREAIESRGDDFARASAFSALGYLVRSRSVMSDSEMAAYLLRMLREMRPRRESIVWMAWAACAANLGYDELRPEVIRLNEGAFIPESAFSPELFDERIDLVSRDASGLVGFHTDLVHPVVSAIDALELLLRVGGDDALTGGGYGQSGG